jgi:beta-galactosidase/beta-glucuronidase
MLNFDAVDWQADVYVNDIHVGTHRGGYTAFSIDITPYLVGKGSQKLVVRVFDPTNKGYQPVGKQTLTPHSIWYTAVSGIWQTVWLEPVAENHITHIASAADIRHGCVELTLRSSGENDGSIVEAELTDGGETVASAKGMPNGTLRLRVSDAKLWSPEHPFLYGLRLTMKKGNKVVDRVA